MAFNQVQQFYRGFVSSNGNVGVSPDGISGIIAGLGGLLLKGSTDLAGVCVDPSGNIYVTDAGKHIVLKITESGNIYVLAGLSGTSGNNADNVVSGSDARFNYPTGITCDRNGDLFVCDTNNHQIRKISNNKVSLVAGASIPSLGTADGEGTLARFNAPHGIDINASGVLYVADTSNHAIRMIKGSLVSTLAGLKGTSGDIPVWADMTTSYGISGVDARFNNPKGIAVNQNGYVLVCDTDNSVIKRVDNGGNVRIFSGNGTYGTTIGTAKTSSYQNPIFADFDKSNGLYVVDFDESGASRLLRINEDGVPGTVVNFNGTSSGPYLAAIASNPAGHLIVVASEYADLAYSSSSSSRDSSSSSSRDSSSSSSSSSLSSESSSSSSSESSSSSSSLNDYIITLDAGGTAVLGTAHDNIITYTGIDGTTAIVTVNGTDFTIGNVSEDFVWDISGGGQHTFTFIGESIVRNVGLLSFTVVWDGFGSLLFTVGGFNQLGSSSSSSSSESTQSDSSSSSNSSSSYDSSTSSSSSS